MCQRHAVPTLQKPALRPIKTTECWQILGMDLVYPGTTTESGNKWILTVTDLFSKFVFAEPIKSKEASSVAEALISFVTTYGAPERIITDQGREFNNEVNIYFIELA